MYFLKNVSEKLIWEAVLRHGKKNRLELNEIGYSVGTA